MPPRCQPTKGARCLVRTCVWVMAAIAALAWVRFAEHPTARNLARRHRRHAGPVSPAVQGRGPVRPRPSAGVAATQIWIGSLRAGRPVSRRSAWTQWRCARGDRGVTIDLARRPRQSVRNRIREHQHGGSVWLVVALDDQQRATLTGSHPAGRHIDARGSCRERATAPDRGRRRAFAPRAHASLPRRRRS